MKTTPKKTSDSPSKIYKWKNKWHNPKSDVSLIGAEIELIAASHPNDLHKAMVRAAKNKQDPMHWEFTWDDAKAAHAHRLVEARDLHNRIVIVSVVSPCDNQPEASRSIPIVVSLCEPQTQNTIHRSLEAVLSNPDERDQLLSQALRDLEAFQARYNQLSELAVVFKAIRKITASHRSGSK